MIPTPIHGGKDPDDMNVQRLGWGLDLIDKIMALTGTDHDDAVSDAIAYLLHAACYLKQDPARELICAIHHFNADFSEELGSIPVPYGDQGATRGVAYNSLDNTLIYVDTSSKRIIEIQKDGTPTGRSVFVPNPSTTLYNAGCLAFDPTGNGGLGSVYVTVHSTKGILYEMTLGEGAGALIRAFPDFDDPERFLGPGVNFGLQGGFNF